ncbi:MAG: Ferredoxin reductase [Herminiimonas sp.]|nr:Ferredoxin reductase [Herminiimonas sp.]
MDKNLVIVGASYAGAQLAASARDKGFEGRILLVGEEAHLPYQRPPLSKGFLTGKVTEASLAMRSPAFYAEERIEFKSEARVAAIDRNAREVSLASGERIPYDFLGLTTGARCRELGCEGADLAGVHYLRGVDDAKRLTAAAADAERVVIIGGGFIGLEVAASLRAVNKRVTVIESQPRLLARAFPEMLSRFIHSVHASNGIEFVFGGRIGRLNGRNGKVESVELADSQVIPCDLVLVAIGVIPNTGLAEACGLTVSDGIVVDACARTSDPAIVAAGDCARYPNPWGAAGTVDIRLESVQSANDLARAAASTVAGLSEPYSAVPWFWSDQGELKLQMTGLSAGADQMVVRGEIDGKRFSVFYFSDGKFCAVDTVNHPAEHIQARKLLAARVPFSPAQASDVTVNLKALIPGAPT